MSNAEAWAKLTAPVPAAVLKPLDAVAAGGLTGMSDIPEWYIYDRLRESGLPWSETITAAELVAHVDKTFYYVERVRLTIDGQDFDGIGGHDHSKLEWAVKGAHTSAFKDAAKWAGITMSVWKGGPNGHAAPVAAAPAPQARPAASNGDPGTVNYGKCPTHQAPLVHRSGVSKKTGKPYDMVACPERDCRFILPDADRARVEAHQQPRPVVVEGAARRPEAPVIGPRTHPAADSDLDTSDPGFLASLEESGGEGW